MKNLLYGNNVPKYDLKFLQFIIYCLLNVILS